MLLALSHHVEETTAQCARYKLYNTYDKRVTTQVMSEPLTIIFFTRSADVDIGFTLSLTIADYG
jgi:hypothetical protein